MNRQYRGLRTRLAIIAVAVMAAVGTAAVGAFAERVERPLERPAARENGNNQFAVDLYARLSADAKSDAPANLFFSPQSLSTALAMTHAGANGKTAEQIQRTAHLDGSAGAFRPGHRRTGGYQLSVGNAMWGRKGYGFAPDYVNLLLRDYVATFRELEFASNADESRKTINAWAERQTQGKVKDLMPPPTVTADTVLVLTNAIYFKGKWAQPFKKERTAPAPFFVAGDKSVEAPMMTQQAKFRRLIADKFQVLELPYGGGELSMVILLPEDRDGLAAFERSMIAGAIEAWLKQLSEAQPANVHVTVPKFTASGTFSLAKALAEMGMPDAFDPAKADFSGMNGGKEPLSISAVVHKAFVAVDEEGTEAAAATGVSVTRGSVEIATPPFRADHPFVFLIRDSKSGSILFMGRVMNPVTSLIGNPAGA